MHPHQVSLYWLLDQGRGKWFPGEIAKCCIKGGTRRDGLVSNRWHLVEYDDGDEAWCDLKVFMQQGHLRWKRGGAGWGERAYCETCDLHFESEAALTAHQAKRHCELTEDTAAPAPGHVSEGREGGLSHGMDGVFYCELCDMHFKNAAALYGHSGSKKHRTLTHRQGQTCGHPGRPPAKSQSGCPCIGNGCPSTAAQSRFICSLTCVGACAWISTCIA